MTSMGSTSIDNLPTANNEENVVLQTTEKNNIIVEDKARKLQKEREADLNIKNVPPVQMDVNKFVSGIQEASSSGMLSLPSRDIPHDKDRLIKDENIKPNFIPKGAHPTDYITEHQTSEEIIKQNAKKQQSQDNLDILFTELALPTMIAALYFAYQLPAVRKMFIKSFPFCYNKSGDKNIYGFLVNSLVFGAIIYSSNKVVNHLSK